MPRKPRWSHQPAQLPYFQKPSRLPAALNPPRRLLIPGGGAPGPEGPVATSQSRAVLSSDPVATVRPSGLNATLRTSRECPSSVAAQVPVATSQSRAVLSSDPVATVRPSGLNATLVT